MPTYISLISFTDQGIRNIKESPKRVKAARSVIEKAGGKWIAYYYTLGQYDAVAITEFPSDEIAMSTLMAIGSLGNVRTTTLKALPESEGFKVIQKLP